MRTLASVVVGVCVIAFIAAGCGGAIPSSNGGPAMVKLAKSKHGAFLVDAEGHTLYLFDKDENGESYCNGACAAVWPPFESSSQPRASAGVDAGALGRIKRDDGDMQVTYRGHPLYYYAADASTPGKVTGESVDQFGAEWYVVNAHGKAVEEAKGSQEKSHSSGGGGGWG
jgi:predicted lipoprotein with Yx(FWY)xxD motif